MKRVSPRVRIDSGSTDEWVTLDLSEIIGDDLGDVVGIGVTVHNTAGTDQFWQLRHPDSTDEFNLPELSGGYGTDADIGIKADGTVQLWRSSADIQVWLTTLYFADKAEFFVDALDVTPGTGSTWTDTDLGSSAGEDTPQIVFGLFHNDQLDLNSFGVRPDGWTSNDPEESWPGRHLAGWKVPCSESGIFEAYTQNPTDSRIYVTGYLYAGAHVVPTPPAAGTFLSQADVYELVDCSTLPEQYRVALLRLGHGLTVRDTGANTMAARTPGDTDDLTVTAVARHVFIALDDQQRAEVKLGHATNERVHILAGATLVSDEPPPPFVGGMAELVTVEHDLVEAEVTQSTGGTPPRFVQWQRSDDDGESWDDISGQDELAYRVEPVAGESYLLRARQYDSASPAEEAFSDELTVTVPDTPTIDVDYMISSVDGENIRIKALLQGEESSVRLAYSDDPNMLVPSYTIAKGVDSANDFLIFDEVIPIASLDPDKRYYYAIDIDGVLCGKRGRFRTPPERYGSFKFVLGYCADTIDPDTNAGDMIGTEHIRRHSDALIWLFPGDFHYKAYKGTDLATRRANYRNQLIAPRFGRAARSMHLNYVYDDHCGYETSGWASKEASLPARAAVVTASKQVFPWETAAEDGTFRAFTLGRVRFIALDERTYRDLEGDTDDENKIHLGATQEAWYKAELLAANADPDIAIIAVIHCVPYIGTDEWDPDGTPSKLGDNWGIYQTERQRLADWEQANGIKGHKNGGKVVRIFGDMHGMGFDDGTADDYATVGEGTGAPSYTCGGLSRGSHVKGTPWSHGASSGLLGNQSLTKLAVFWVDDDGGDTVTLRASYREFAPEEEDADNYEEPFGTEALTGTTAIPLLTFSATPAGNWSEWSEPDEFSIAPEIDPGPASLEFTGYAPTVTATDHQEVTPSPASLVFTGRAPVISTTDDVELAPDPAAIAFTGYAPTIVTNVEVAPSAGAVQFTGYAPTVEAAGHVVVTPAPAVLEIVGYPPTLDIGGNVFLTPEPAGLRFTGHSPTIRVIDRSKQIYRVAITVESL